jgi:hypothetical protein
LLKVGFVGGAARVFTDQQTKSANDKPYSGHLDPETGRFELPGTAFLRLLAGTRLDTTVPLKPDTSSVEELRLD